MRSFKENVWNIRYLKILIVVRCKFTATPLRPTYLQRQALRRLIDAFSASQIRFAAPNVTVQLTSAAVLIFVVPISEGRT